MGYDYYGMKDTMLELIEQGKISRADAARVFPELAEGKDERMLKSLISYMKGEEDDCEFNVQEMLSWLLQCRSGWTKDDDDFENHILPRILRPEGWTLEQNEADKKRLNDFIERQKVKLGVIPILDGWTEDDEKMLTLVIETIRRYIKMPHSIINGCESNLDSARKIELWLKSIRWRRLKSSEKGWVAVDGDGTMCVYTKRPRRQKGSQTWIGTVIFKTWDKSLFPDVQSWDDEPREVQFVIL